MTFYLNPVSLDLVVALGEAGSISGAARRVGMSQPAASVRLRELEEQLGLDLLQRVTSGASLNEDGRVVALSARRALEALAEVVSVASRRREERGGTLRLAASLTVAEYLLPTWLAPLYGVSPPITVSLRMANSREVAALLEAGEVDVGFIEGWRQPPGFEGRSVHLDELVIIVSPEHPWARRRRPVRSVDGAGAALVGREPGSGTREVLEDALAERGLRAHYAVELASTTALKESVAQGVGPAVVSRLVVLSDIALGRLVEVPVRDLELTRVIRALWRQGTTLSDAGRRLLGETS